MTYYDKFHCINCPVDKFCGTAVSAIKLCQSLNDSVAQMESQHVLTLSRAAIAEEEAIEERLTMWDNIKE